MNGYYKIYKDGMIVDVNHLFFRYQPKYGRIVPCQPKDAQLICDSKRTNFYTTNWLHILDVEVPGVSFIEAEEISKEEYEKLKKELAFGKPVPEAPVEEIPAAAIEMVEEQPEKVFSPIEMKEIINSLEKRIEKLENIIQKLSN